MGKNIVEKILEAHLVSGKIKEGELIGVRVDQVYTQDATGTMAWLEFEAIGIDRVRVPLAVSYVDHNMLQSNFMNADDHLFLRTAAAKFGAYFSRPGNGICHQVHLERFAAPGRIALGTDSHTPTGGGMGMIAIGVGGLEAASVMAGMPFEFTMPKVVRINLSGKLRRPYVTAMDVILTLLKMLSVKGGVGKIFEYGGEGVKDLSVTERATITNMGAELGATTSIFPSDENTLKFLKAQGRQHQWIELQADEDAEYSEIIELNLSEIEPMIAQPHSPDNVVAVREIKGMKVHQVCIGSCTNSSYKMMKTVASILNGRTVHEDVTLFVNPGSKQVYQMLAREGDIEKMISAGARILESACGPCIGMGGAPGSGQISVRSYNRNFKGRSGTKDAFVYLASPVVCALTAIKGEIVDPFDTDIPVNEITEPDSFLINDNTLIPPKKDKDVKIIKGPNIKEVPVKEPLEENIEAEVLLKLSDNITTDDILPAGTQVLPYRSNIPEISKFTFKNIDETFYERAVNAKTKGGGIIVGGENYGQGSSREHAAIAPMYLGIKAVVAKSFARIHRANLINFGILPLIFVNPEDYEKVNQGDILRLSDLVEGVKGSQRYLVFNKLKNTYFEVYSNLNEKERELILQGGLLPYVRKKVIQ
ncbi:aconitate hydratase [Thermodesulfovibrio aggregans]|uniref:Aconitate hydratase A n=1 Tax=Thermodesulfovibrio aggregans TaxID=86166 RepID=A0A0U9HLS8_9BACT|nr:aconitate hydratase [Thermodesulfovibrio aggregans]GAQ94028.1 aconitate hydratase [Thermodesulfovibrio aggregans]